MSRLRVVLGVLLVLPAPALAQSQRAQVVAPVLHDVSPRLRDMRPAPWPTGYLEAEPVRQIPSHRNPSFQPDALVQEAQSAVTQAAPAATVNFDGIGNGVAGYSVFAVPPDNNGAAGTTQFVETVNTAFAVYSKATGGLVFGPVSINTLWTGFSGGCQNNNDGDPTVVFDHLAQRWVISQFSVSTTPYLQCVAVSTSADATGSYYRYAYSYGSTTFPDYPKMGVWPDGYYVTYNMFNSSGTSFLGAKACAFDRASMLSGGTATQQCFDTSTTYGGLLPADLDGSTLPPASAPNYLVALGASSTTLAVWKFHVDWTTPANSTFTGPTAVAVASYSEACGISGTCIPQSGGVNLDALSDRLMYRAAYRNFGDHESLVVNHAVTAGTSVGVRWYELRGLSGTPTAYQQGTYAPDGSYRWMGSIAMDRSGNMALGYSVSSSSLKPQIRYTGRLAADPAGTMGQGEATIFNGAGAQSTYSRWGDYTSMSIDPVDDCTFWYTNQYLPANGVFNWRTRVAAFKFAGCGTTTPDFTLAATPSSQTVTRGSTTSYTVTETPLNGFADAVTLSVSGVPSGASASFAPNPTNGSSTLTVSTTSSTPGGTYTLTITGTGGSLVHTTTVQLVVTVPAQFTISSTPTSRTITRGQSTTYAITVNRIGGFSGGVSLSVSGLPPNVTGSFSPNPAAGTASTLTITSTRKARRGTFTLTITGTSSGVPSATTTVTLTLQ